MRTPSISSLAYAPGQVPQDMSELVRFLTDELVRISAAISSVSSGHIDPLHVEPTKPRDGDFRFADGTNWNPGGGEGPYIYYNGTWNPFMATDAVTEVATRGTFGGRPAMLVTVIGARTRGWSSSSIMGDCAEYLDTSQATINAVSTGSTYYVRSSSANDTAAGTGVQSVKIVSLDSSGNMVTSTVAMNGTTGVSLGSGFSAFQCMESAAVGSGGVAAGDITISTVSGAPTVAQTVEMMTAGNGRALSARFKVPAGYTAYVLGWDNGAISTNADCRLRGQVYCDDKTLSPGFHFMDRMWVPSNGRGEKEMHLYPVPAGAEIKISCIPANTAAGNRLDSSFDLILAAN